MRTQGDNFSFFAEPLLNVFTMDPEGKPIACIIWLHGLGADAQDMVGLAKELPLNVPIRHVFMDAPIRRVTINYNMPMRAWYDIIGTQLTDREDKAGILESAEVIREVIRTQTMDSFRSEQVFLAGFSQGGAMALYTGLSTEQPLAGIIALSSYLPLAEECKLTQATSMPVFMAAGEFDQIVQHAWSSQSAHYLRQNKFKKVTFFSYPMEHTISQEEIGDLALWIKQILKSKPKDEGEDT